MKKTNILIAALMLMAGIPAMADTTINAPENPATGIWIQQIGDIVPHGSTKATLYYTKYEQEDRVKSISYQYNGAGYLLMKPSDKKTLCTMGEGVKGADGIVHHPDGDLLVAGQGVNIYKVSKTARAEGGKCHVKTATPATSTSGFWHLMMDPSQKTLWGAGIPGPLYRFSTETDPAVKNFADKGFHVQLNAESASRRKDNQLATIIWDGEGTAFFTYSDYYGGGCEANTSTGQLCSESSRKSRLAGSYFGMFIDTTWTKVTDANVASVGGKVGDSVITAFKTRILIDSLEGAHGGAYDKYSQTIFVFGGSKIVQIEPYREDGMIKAKVVATIDLREYFFVESSANLTGPRTPGVGWRLDQGTTDGYGHLFVASNTGHMIFVDYAANPKKRIDNNILIHVQWVDNYLDDLAPLSGVGYIRDFANTGSDEDLSSSSMSSSSLVEWSSSSSEYSSSSAKSSSSVVESSSSEPVVSSSSEAKSSSSSEESVSSSSGVVSSSSSGIPGSSSSGENGESSSSNGDSSSSGNVTSSSSGVAESSSSANVPGSSAGNSESSSSVGENSSSSENNVSHSSSSSKNNGAGVDIDDPSSSSRIYFGATDEDFDDGSGLDDYPSADDFEKGDSLVNKVVVLSPVDPDPSNPNIIIIDGNSYLLNNNPSGIEMNLSYSTNDSAKVGDVIAIVLDKDKIKEFFGDADSLTLKTDGRVDVVNPTNGAKHEQLVIDSEGNVIIYVTADEVVRGGTIKVYGNGQMAIIDNINFYDPIPDSRVGYIKDSDDDGKLDYVEILLKDPLANSYYLDGVKLVIGKDTLTCTNPKMNEAGDRIFVDASDLKLPKVGELPEDAKAIISYGDKAGSGAVYYRDSPLVEIGSNVIKNAYAIRDKDGLDSLFIQFNIDLIPADVGSPEMLVMLKQEAERYGFELGQIKRVYMPTKDIVILTGKKFGLKGGMKDSISLYPDVVFENLPFITSDEYDREVPVTVVDRFPSVANVEYWDTDGDGTLDQIVSVFDSKLTADDIKETLYMTFPWYSFRGMLIQLQAQPADLKIDPKDSTRVIWNVVSPTRLAEGVTSISEDLPQANIYTYYNIFGETFVSEETAPLVDRMSPVVSAATLSYGKKADTLTIVFSEPIKTKNLKGDDYFSYIHGNDTLDLDPKRIDWSADGLSAKLIIDGDMTTILPGDSLLVKRGAKDEIRDNFGNVAGENPQSVIIGGLLNHLVESTTMGEFDALSNRVVDRDSNKTYTLQTVSSVNLRYVPGTTTKEDMEKEGALGQLVQLGERFVPQLIDRAQVAADGSYDPSVLDSLKPQDVYITFIVNYYDHLGQYVNDTIITVPCNSPKFGGNCLETDQKVFVNWNFKDHKGRFVGTGIYNVQFKMIVRYEKKRIVEEMKDKWGVRRKKSKKK